jgi:hypothetical protein
LQNLCTDQQPVMFGDDRLPPRFWDKVEPDPSSGCWRWTACTNAKGYGSFGVATRQTALAHRVAYEATVGPIPSGRECDHICRVRCCVNPSHIEPVTHAENVRRGRGGEIHGSKTHCKHGHEFSEGNTYWRPSGGRTCKECDRAQKRARYTPKGQGGGRRSHCKNGHPFSVENTINQRNGVRRCRTCLEAWRAAKKVA